MKKLKPRKPPEGEKNWFISEGEMSSEERAAPVAVAGRSDANTRGNESDPSIIQPGRRETSQVLSKITQVSALPREGSLPAAGPPTPKQRSKYNALKHGVFSKVILLKDESRADYKSLLNGLREYFQPEGALEEVLVEKLATLLWRHRRLIVAERAEIQSQIQFIDWGRQNRQQAEADRIECSSALEYRGLIRDLDNPLVLNSCLKLLTELRDRFSAKGFTPEDEKVLKTISGEAGENQVNESLYDEYLVWSDTAKAPEAERLANGYASPEGCKLNVLDRIDAEIRRLKRHRKTYLAIEAERARLQALRPRVPESPTLDRLLKYEASLERSFDRTLSQLEHLQRMRRGQPVPPTVKVELS